MLEILENLKRNQGAPIILRVKADIKDADSFWLIFESYITDVSLAAESPCGSFYFWSFGICDD